MTIAQIGAILAILTAFNVGSTTVAKVSTILMTTVPTVQTTSGATGGPIELVSTTTQQTVAQAAPQFVQLPTITGENATHYTLTWTTDSPVTSKLYISYDPNHLGWNPRQSFDVASTSFSAQIPTLSMFYYYKVVINNSGGSQSNQAQVHATPLL